MKDWVGLPAGVKFDPTDQELIEHLEAKVKEEGVRSHPLIDEFIPTIEGEDGICYTHPEKLPGMLLSNKIIKRYPLPYICRDFIEQLYSYFLHKKLNIFCTSSFVSIFSIFFHYGAYMFLAIYGIIFLDIRTMLLRLNFD